MTSKLHISIDGTPKEFREFRGLGVQWDPYRAGWVNEKEWNEIIKRLDYMQPALVRLMIYAPLYCEGIDEKGDPVYKFNSDGMHSLLRELDYLEEKHIEVILGEWEAPGRFGKTFEGINAANPLWAKIICGFLNYLLNEKKYTCIKYFNYVNEANSEWSWCADWDQWRSGIINLRDEMKKYGLQDRIGITGPDSVWDDDDRWIRNLAGDEIIKNAISLYDIHMYPTLEDIRSGAVLTHACTNHQIAPDKDFYMTEVGLLTGKTMGDSQPNVKEYFYGVVMADTVAQVVNGGLNGLSIWDLDDAMHDQGNGYPKTDIRSLKQWGFFCSVGGRVFGMPEEEKIRPHFFTWSLMSRSFRPGSHVLNVTGDTHPVCRTLAMSSPDGKLNIMLVNDSDEDAEITLELDRICPHELTTYVYRENGRAVDGEGFPQPEGCIVPDGKQLDIHLEALSVIFLTEDP